MLEENKVERIVDRFTVIRNRPISVIVAASKLW